MDVDKGRRTSLSSFRRRAFPPARHWGSLLTQAGKVGWWGFQWEPQYASHTETYLATPATYREIYESKWNPEPSSLDHLSTEILTNKPPLFHSLSPFTDFSQIFFWCGWLIVVNFLIKSSQARSGTNLIPRTTRSTKTTNTVGLKLRIHYRYYNLLTLLQMGKHQFFLY